MKYVCDAPGKRTWFRIETEAEVVAESQMMRHAVDKFFRREHERARLSYQPGPGLERDVGLKGHIARATPYFLTLRADDGEGLATAMLPPEGRLDPRFRIIIVGPDNADPYPVCADAIEALGRFFKLTLDRARCFPYAR